MAVKTWKRGTTIKGTFLLRTVDACDSSKTNTYPIPTGATIQMNLPGTSGTVTITSTASEIVVVGASTGNCSFTISATKSALLKLGTRQSIDVLVTELSGDITAFEEVKSVTIEDLANP